MVCTTWMTIHIHKANLYMNYQSAGEILSILASRGYCLKMPLNTVFVPQYTTKTSTVSPHFYYSLRTYMTC